MAQSTRRIQRSTRQILSLTKRGRLNDRTKEDKAQMPLLRLRMGNYLGAHVRFVPQLLEEGPEPEWEGA